MPANFDFGNIDVSANYSAQKTDDGLRICWDSDINGLSSSNAKSLTELEKMQYLMNLQALLSSKEGQRMALQTEKDKIQTVIDAINNASQGE